MQLSADVVVIGSGAGGAPVAAVLAESGRSVVVLEAGPRVETGDFTGDEGEMTTRLWKAGLAGNSLTLYAGACVGGSTVINDAVCFRPPGRLLEVVAGLLWPSGPRCRGHGALHQPRLGGH